MANWIFVAKAKEDLTARKVLETRLADKFWGLGERTPNRRSLKKGDRIIFYIGAPDYAFAATAVLASDSFSVPEERREALSHGKNLFRAEYGVALEASTTWPTPKPVPELAPNLEFTGGRPDWGCFLQGGVRGISDADYNRIVQHISGTVEPKTTEAVGTVPTQDDQLFALERHLEDFIENNWAKIGWNRKLSLYVSDAGSGRQFPAGKWGIDFLATDDETKAFVVIELKRGQSSDDTVGQVLRYIGWVRENIAKPNEKVEGIIVCSEVDDALKFAVRELEHVSVMRYKVSFSLTQPEL